MTCKLKHPKGSERGTCGCRSPAECKENTPEEQARWLFACPACGKEGDVKQTIGNLAHVYCCNDKCSNEEMWEVELENEA